MKESERDETLYLQDIRQAIAEIQEFTVPQNSMGRNHSHERQIGSYLLYRQLESGMEISRRKFAGPRRRSSSASVRRLKGARPLVQPGREWLPLSEGCWARISPLNTEAFHKGGHLLHLVPVFFVCLQCSRLLRQSFSLPQASSRLDQGSADGFTG